MRMRQLAGRYAGEILEFPFSVAERCSKLKPPTMVKPNTPDDPYSDIGKAAVKRKRGRPRKEK